MPDTYKVALAQASYDWSRQGATVDNLLKARDFVKRAARAKARVVVFSEYFLGDIAVEQLPSAPISELQAQAKRSRINIVCGITRNRVREQPREQYLTSVVISKRGEVLGMPCKAIYNPTERPWFDKVCEVAPVEVDGVMVGVLSGYDIVVPEVPRLLVEKGAELLLYQLSASTPEERNALQASVISTAYYLGVPVAAVGQLGEFMKRQYLGGSIAVSPRSLKAGVMEVADGVEVLAEMDEEEDMAVVDFDLRGLQAMRKRFSFRDLVPEELG